MKIHSLAFVIFLAGCAASMDELIVEAKECVNNSYSVDERGVIGDPTDEQKTICWNAVNNRVETIEKRAHERALESQTRCPKGMVKVCRVWSVNDRTCGCATRMEIGRVLGR